MRLRYDCFVSTVYFQLIETNVEELARWECFDNGKPLYEARMDVMSCVDTFRFFAGVGLCLADVSLVQLYSQAMHFAARMCPLISNVLRTRGESQSGLLGALVSCISFISGPL